MQELSLEEDRTGDPTQLDRIEMKLDYLISALAEEEEHEGPTHDLDGNPLPAARDESEEL